MGKIKTRGFSAMHEDRDDLADLRVRIDQQPDGTFMAHIQTIATDGKPWNASSDPRRTRLAAVFQVLAMATGNEQMD